MRDANVKKEAQMNYKSDWGVSGKSLYLSFGTCVDFATDCCFVLAEASLQLCTEATAIGVALLLT